MVVKRRRRPPRLRPRQLKKLPKPQLKNQPNRLRHHVHHAANTYRKLWHDAGNDAVPSATQDSYCFFGSDGSLLFINDTTIPVITRGNPTENAEIPVIQLGG